MKIVSSEAMAMIDRRAQDEFAIPSQLLMEDAGVAGWELFVRAVCGGRLPRGPLVFLAGKGNNGGDAHVMARRAICMGARDLLIVLAGGRPREGNPVTMLAMCERYGIPALSWPEDRERILPRLAAAAWILDGVSGTGLHGALRSPLSDLVREVNALTSAKKVAIDVPSGVSDSFDPSWPAVRADVTLTMGLPKLCLYLPHARALCGKILVVPVGFPPELVNDPAIPGEALSFSAWRKIVTPIPPDTHKNRRGHLVVFAGSPGTTGAAWLSATAAARSRLGLVSLYAGRDIYSILAEKATSVMVKPWDEPHPPEWGGPDLAPYTGVLVGPGWGLAEGRERWLEHLLSQRLPGAIDADGITLLSRIAGRGRVALGGRWVLTPHPGEFARISGVPRDDVLRDPVSHARKLSSRLEAVVVLKGHCTIVASPSGPYWIIDGPNAALATGGSGDVLAGLIAAGIAGGLSAVDGALFGVSLHACLGRTARRRLGWFLAEDLVPLVSRVLK